MDSKMLVVDTSALIAKFYRKDQVIRAPICIPVSQISICLPDGTPIFLAGEYGPNKSYIITRLGDKDFDYALELFQEEVRKVEIVTPDLKT